MAVAGMPEAVKTAAVKTAAHEGAVRWTSLWRRYASLEQ